MSGYLPLDLTYTTSSIMSSTPTLTAQVADLLSPYQKIVPQADYQVSVHPTPFQYYSLQHGVEPSNAYFTIYNAYNGICSTPGFRECTGTVVQTSLPTSS